MRPNVLVIMSDEQSWDTLGYTGNPAARTPHLDALAERATVFDRCYTPFPLCCPSRASLWTGLMPRHHHVLGNWKAIRPDLREVSVGRAFHDAGYHTIYNGKWHVPGTTPARMGFADASAIPAVLDGRDRGRYIEPYREYVTQQGYDLVPGHIENLTHPDLASLRDRRSPLRTTADIELDHYLEPWQTDRFLEALDRRPDDRPWFAVASYNAPHFPLAVPRPYDRIIDRGRVRLPASNATGPSTKPAEVRDSRFATDFAALGEGDWIEIVAHYLGFCALIDDQVGRILDHLDAIGELDRTIIVFTSDHGDMMGAHGLMEKGHSLHYEEVLRVPLILYHPDGQPARTDSLASVIDLAPTLADLGGVTLGDDRIDGRSLADLAGGSSNARGREYVTAETVLYDMSHDGHGEYHDPADWDPDKDGLNLSIRTATTRYIYRSHDVDELYDHDHDPGEQRNLAADPAYAADRARLRGLLADDVKDVFPEVSSLLIADHD